MTEKRIIGAGLILFAGLGAFIYFILTKNKTSKPVPTIEEYYEGKDKAAEEGGAEAVKGYCTKKWGSSGQFYDACIKREHDKMLAQIANHNYSGCVKAYKRCHKIPSSGEWGKEPYNFCSDAIVNYREHVSPEITEIVEQGAKIVVHPESARTRDKNIIHPDAYKWITTHTECKDLNCEHYHDYAVGWQDARINGYYENDSNFYDKVMEFAGKKRKWFGGGWKW